MEPPEADEAATDGEEGFVDLCAAVVADEQSFEMVEPGEGAFDDPACAAESGAVSEVAVGDLGLDAAVAELAAEGVGVVAAVGGDAFGPATRMADTAAHRRYALDQRHELGYVVAVAACDRPRERDPGRVDEEVVLRPGSGSINRARARLGAPFFACT